MRVVVVGGRQEHGARLGRIAERARLLLEVERVDPPGVAQLDAAQTGSGDVDADGVRPLALVLEALDRPGAAVTALQTIKADAAFEEVAAIVSLSPGYVGLLDGTSGFDDFMLHPYSAEELAGRLRSLTRRNPPREPGDIVVDRAGQEVRIEGRNVALTAKEFALLAYLCERRGRVFSREHLLDRVWGSHYAVGSRTVDIHVRRLRAKLGSALPLETLRGRGYKLRREPSAGSSSVDPSQLGLASE